jgi:hypothetical protein
MRSDDKKKGYSEEQMIRIIKAYAGASQVLYL